MQTPLFSIVAIMRNEEKVLPRLLDSLKPYFDAGGDCSILDTGSTDNSVAIARSYGCKVEEVGEKYLLEVDNVMGINQRFVAEGEKQIVKKGDKYFNFSAARNHAASLAKNDYVFFYDCDEVSVNLNIDVINEHIRNGMTQSEYNFVFSYDVFGREAVKFIQCKAYDRRYMKWAGIVHELVVGYAPHSSQRVFLDESIYKLGHHQNQESGRHIYLVGLAQDCFNDPKNDRHSHYLARELFWTGRHKSALKEFKRHVQMGGWAAERAESYIFMGKCYGFLGNPTEEVRMFNEAFYLDAGRNKALMELAFFYKHNNNHQAAVCYAKASLEIPHGGFYADDLAYYQNLPHEILYSSYGQCPHIPNYIEKAKEHLLKALEFQPYNPQYLRDTQFYFEYPDQGHIQGWMRFPELQWLYEQAKSGKYKNMFECGSWKGKSTHALLSGLKNVEGATLTCVDTWAGSSDERDDTHHMAKKEDVFAEFQKNTSGFNNLRTIRKSSVDAAKDVPDKSIDWCFIDMGHDYDSVMSDLRAWFPKIKKDGIICGHDHTEGTWQEVVQAVRDFFGCAPHQVIDSIWYFDLSKYDIIPDNNVSVDGLPALPVFKNGEQIIHKAIEFTYADGELVTQENPAIEPEKVFVNEEKPDLVVYRQTSYSGPGQHNLFNKNGDWIGEKRPDEKIPRKIWTCWFGDEMPELVKKCIDSQATMCAKFGYDFQLITLDFIQPFARDYKYLNECLGSQHPNGVKYCKMTDYLRMLYLKQHGGWFLDADIEILPGKSFDDLLGEKMVVGLEEANWEAGKVVLGTAIVGAVPYHPMIIEWLETVERDHVGWDNRNYESSMDLLNKIGVKHQENMKLLDPEVFFPKHSVTGEVNITPRTITVHHFLKTWTPQSTLQQFKYNIENNINFTFVKRGDGELACMSGVEGANCDGHPYSKELGDKLRESYEYLQSVGAHIVEFDDQKNYNVLLHRTDNNLQELSDFYKAIAKSNRPKIFVGPERLSEWAYYLKANHIVVPEINAFESLDSIFEKATAIGNWWEYQQAIFIFCAGMPAKPLIERLRKWNDNATYLDCGSAFDPSVHQSRTWQITKEQFWELYKEEGVEPVDPLVLATPIPNNFNLPQETHPERLWAQTEATWAHFQTKENPNITYDIGCGTHKTFAEAIGVDIREGVTDVCCSMDELPFDNDSGDVIISRHAQEHSLDQAKTIKEFIRVLKPGGKMIFVLPDHEYINTLDDLYSRGQHLHAYTRESFKNFLSLFPELHVTKCETVLENWSFGVVVRKLPEISVIIPHIEGTRELGLLECISSIMKQGYPSNLFDVAIVAGEKTVPQKIAQVLNDDKKYDGYVYAANDMTFEPNSLRTAVIESMVREKGLVSFNEGNILPDRGNECTHFYATRELISQLERGELFSLDLHHVGVDQFLVAQAEKLNQYYHCKEAKIIHHHFSKNGNEFDSTYQRGWSHVDQDRKVLAEKLLSLESK